MPLLDDLRHRRKLVYEKARSLADAAAAENRAFDADEESAWQSLNAELDAYDSRIGQVAAQEQRAADTEQYFRKLQAQPVERRMPMSGQDADLDHAFRSAIKARNPAPIDVPVSSRSYYQPGLEQRDILKSTATQAMPVSVYDRIVMSLVENSAIMRAGATVINTPTGEDLQIPKSTAFSTAALTSEGSAITESDPTLNVVTLKAYKYGVLFQVSHELANDTATDLVGFLTDQAAQALAQAFGPHLISGTGTNQPTGVLSSTTVGVTGPTGTASSFGTQGTVDQGTDALIGLHGSLAEPYVLQDSRAWLMRNATLTAFRKLKDSNGQPVIAGDADNYLGAPFVVDPSMPAMGANANSVAYGDFSRYFIRIAEGLRFERSNDYAFNSDLVTFRALIRLDGALVDLSAVKTFKHSAT